MEKVTASPVADICDELAVVVNVMAVMGGCVISGADGQPDDPQAVVRRAKLTSRMSKIILCIALSLDDQHISFRIKVRFPPAVYDIANKKCLDQGIF